MMPKRCHNLKEIRLTVSTFTPKEKIIVRKHFFISWNSTFYGRHFMYDISLPYMMHLPVSHSIPLTIILHSAFCKIPLPEVTNKDPKREPRSGKYFSYLSAVSLKAYIRIRTIPFIPFLRQPGSFVVNVCGSSATSPS